jgi:diketogulonate reductase-like aldo/keto reductase
MLTRPIPSTNEPLPVIGVGTWQAFDVGPDRAALDQRRQVLQALFDTGGSVIDSSPMYGRAEEVVGALLAEMKAHDKAFLATKVWTSGVAAGIAQMKSSLAKFQAPAIDLMQIHNLVDWRTHLRTLREWKQAGRVRYIGVTHYTAGAYDELERVLRAEPLDFVQVNYSLGEREAERRILPLAHERGMAVLVNRPFTEGGLFNRVRTTPLPPWATDLGCDTWAQFFLKWILAHPAVTCVIPATSRVAHLVDNMKAGTGTLPDAATRDRMSAAVR